MRDTVFITGATSGLGQATAALFYKKGWRVIGTGRRRDRLDRLRETLGDRFLGLEFDVSDRHAAEQAIAGIPEAFSRIAVLVNNAGLFAGSALIQDSPLEPWEIMVKTNILGLLYCTRLLLPGMLERRNGHIVNIGSVAGGRAFAGGNVYAASKAFVHHLSDNMRADLLGTPVRVTCLSPGRTHTEFSLVHFDGDEKAAARDYDGGEPLRPEDVADAVWWAISRPARVSVSRLEIMPSCQADAGTCFSPVRCD